MSFNFPICMLAGSTSKPRPTTVAFSTSGSAWTKGHSNDSNAYDVVSGYENTYNTTTYAVLSAAVTGVHANGSESLIATYSGFSGTSGSSGTLDVYLNATLVDSLSSDLSTESISTVEVLVSSNSGGTWTSLITYSGTSTGLTLSSNSISVPSLAALQVMIIVTCQAAYAGVLSSQSLANASLNLYDIVLL